MKSRTSYHTGLVEWGDTRFTVVQDHIVIWGRNTKDYHPVLHIYGMSATKVRYQVLSCHHVHGVFLSPVFVRGQELLAVSFRFCCRIMLYNLVT